MLDVQKALEIVDGIVYSVFVSSQTIKLMIHSVCLELS